ncbi:MAG: hypothetical protein ABWY82_22505 [Tardiphaga sp.]
MQRERLGETQIIPTLEKNEGRAPTAGFCRKRGISDANFWKTKPRRILPLLTACAVVICFVATKDGGLEGGLSLPASAQSPAVSRGGPAQLKSSVPGRAPIVRILRDDRVATLEMDYNARKPAGQNWTMSGSPDDDAGFLVTWWPQATAQSDPADASRFASEGLCISAPTAAATASVKLSATPLALIDLPLGARWIVTGNRRVQLQPLENDRDYRVRVQRLSARGKITSRSTELSFNGGDGARVAALRSSLTYFDDFNLPEGAADERLWNNANSVSTDPRFNLFFINDQFHSHTLHGTRHENTGDRSQTSQRFRKKIRLEPEARRRIVFDMDSPLSPRSAWYLDLNPIPTELTGHLNFFDENGALGLPAGVLRLRSQAQMLSVHIMDLQGASHQVASVNMEELGLQAITNVRRSFDVRVGTAAIQIFIDGVSVINANYGGVNLPAADYELLWVGFGYNTTKDGVPFFLQHWDNFGFDGPAIDQRTVHNYVTQIEGTDFQAARRGVPANFTINIPDDLRPVVSGAIAEAWLVATYQMGDWSQLKVTPADFVRLNGGAQFPLPTPANNTAPLNVSASSWGTPHVARIKLGAIAHDGSSPLAVGKNNFQFNVENAGLLNVHVEVLYPPGSAPTYTLPSAIHRRPRHTELPRLGPPVRFQRIASVDVGAGQHMSNPNRVPIKISGQVPINIEAGNSSWADWAPQLMNVPVRSVEVWATGGTTGIAQVEVFLRRAGGDSEPALRVWQIDTAIDAPAPQGRYLLEFDSRSFPNGEYELFVQATTPSGLKSHPSYHGDELQRFDSADLSGAYYPIPIQILN